MQKLTEEKTFVIVKPDGVKRGLVGEVIRRIEQRRLVGRQLFVCASRHHCRFAVTGLLPHQCQECRPI